MENLLNVIESKFLPYVEKPVRYIGGELNVVKKELYEIKLRGVLCFPDLYDIGMSHFGLQILYHIVNKRKEWALSRCFNPWIDAEKLLRELKIPLYDLEYFSPVKDADWVGFSVQYELQFTNIVNMLDLAGISVLSCERQNNEPLVIAGGPCISNPEPLTDFIDAFALGDGEQTIVSICNVLENEKIKGSSRSQKLEELSRIPGVYVPSLVKTTIQNKMIVPVVDNAIVTASKIDTLSPENYPQRPLVPLIEVVHSRLSVEVMRGCTRGCRFCSAGIYYRPVRERNYLEIYNQICKGIDVTGWRDIGLLSLSTADYSCISSLLSCIGDLKKDYHVSIGLPSTRIDALNEQQLDLYQNVTSCASLTIAPEAGSMRLRKVINKDFTDEIIYETVKRLLERNVQTLKLYFMVGLPTECQEDIDAIVKMVTTISGMLRAKSQRRSLHVAISPFSPKAHTPFGREPMFSVEVLLERSIYIKRALKNLKNVKVSYRDPHITLLETLMARGDRYTGKLIYEAWKNGARFDGWDECFNIERWFKVAEQLNIDINNYLGKISDDLKLPWAAVSTGVTEKFLQEEAKKAFRGETTGDCRTNGCSGCGICKGKIKNNLQKEVTDTHQTCHSEIKRSDNLSDENKSYHYRFIYQKGKSLRFLGHLDMVALIQRSLLMAGVKLAYSNGYNPHARISFGPPLPFAVSGQREAFDIISKKPFNDENLSRINTLLPEELKIIEYRPLSGNEPSLNSTIISALYCFKFNCDCRFENLAEKIDIFLNEQNSDIIIEKNGECKKKNIRPGVLELNADIENKGFTAMLSLFPGLSCKPSELIGYLFPDYSFMDFFVSRKYCYLKNSEII